MLLRSWLETAAAPAHDLAALLCSQSDQLFGGEAGRSRPYLAMLLALPAEEAAAGRDAHLKGEEVQQEIVQALRRWVAALARQGPLVLAFNDLQWADVSSLAALRHCLPVCDEAPVLWLISVRPDRDSPVWNFGQQIATEFPHRLTTIDLPPLTHEESRAQVEEIARKSGSAVISVPALPANIERIAAWQRDLAGRGLVLAPLSAIIGN
jgi:hypothetical protein